MGQTRRRRDRRSSRIMHAGEGGSEVVYLQFGSNTCVSILGEYRYMYMYAWLPHPPTPSLLYTFFPSLAPAPSLPLSSSPLFLPPSLLPYSFLPPSLHPHLLPPSLPPSVPPSLLPYLSLLSPLLPSPSPSLAGTVVSMTLQQLSDVVPPGSGSAMGEETPQGGESWIFI